MILVKDLLAKQFPPENYLVGSGLLRNNSVMVIGGEPKARKSFAIATMFMQLACASPLWWAYRTGKHGEREYMFPVAQPVKCLYLEQEVGEMDMRERVNAMMGLFTLEQQVLIGENLAIHSCDHEMSLASLEGIVKMEKLIEAYKPGVLGLDPLKEFHYADENSSQEMSRVLQPIKKFRDNYGLATVLTHHLNKPSKDGESRGAHDLRGSGYLFGMADTILMLRKLKTPAYRVRCELTLRRDKPLTDFYLLHDFDDSMNMVFDGSTEGSRAKERHGTTMGEIVGELKSRIYVPPTNVITIQRT